jgi:hypothetical protein
MDKTLVVIALIGAGPVTLGHYVTYKVTVAARNNAAEALSIVRGNGRGDVAVMLKDIQNLQERNSFKLDKAIEWQIDHEISHARKDQHQL